MKINENTSISMPMKNMLAIVAGVAMGVFAYTEVTAKPTMRKRLFSRIKAGSKGGKPGQWSARKAQLLASEYKKKGGGYKN